jgi:hypothetical protein
MSTSRPAWSVDRWLTEAGDIPSVIPIGPASSLAFVQARQPGRRSVSRHRQ